MGGRGMDGSSGVRRPRHVGKSSREFPSVQRRRQGGGTAGAAGGGSGGTPRGVRAMEAQPGDDTVCHCGSGASHPGRGVPPDRLVRGVALPTCADSRSRLLTGGACGPPWKRLRRRLTVRRWGIMANQNHTSGLTKDFPLTLNTKEALSILGCFTPAPAAALS